MAGVAGRLARRWCSGHLRSPTQVPALGLHARSPAMRTSQKDFNHAVNQVKLLKEDPGTEVKLKLYALYKQATEGPCNVPKPGMLDFINKTKWDAWNALGSLSKEAARQKYVDLVSSLSASSESPSPEAPAADRKQPEGDSLVVTSGDGITTIRLNRPSKKNALTTQMYRDIIAALQAASKDESVITVLTGGAKVKNLPANAGDIRDVGLTPGSGRSPGGGHGSPLHYSCLETLRRQRSLAGCSPKGHKESNVT